MGSSEEGPDPLCRGFPSGATSTMSSTVISPLFRFPAVMRIVLPSRRALTLPSNAATNPEAARRGPTWTRDSLGESIGAALNEIATKVHEGNEHHEETRRKKNI